MSWSDFDYEPEPEEAPGPGPEDDPAVQEIEPLILALFEANPDQVYYATQLWIYFEKRFFHWVTDRALKALRTSGRIGSSLEEVLGGPKLRYFFHRRNRYWKRQAAEIRKLVLQFSDPTFTHALGHYGENLIDAGLPYFGFLPQAHTARAWNGKEWTDSGNDLDRIFMRDGIAYGAEIKNRLGYIDHDVLTVKLQMCKHLGLVPLFIARMMPKTYIQEVNDAGGFCLIMGRQFYPLAYKALAVEVHTKLGLPVDTPIRIESYTFQRLLNWHTKKFLA